MIIYLLQIGRVVFPYVKLPYRVTSGRGSHGITKAGIRWGGASGNIMTSSVSTCHFIYFHITISELCQVSWDFLVFDATDGGI